MRLRLIGGRDARVEKTVEIELFERYPGFAIYRVTYRNLVPRAAHRSAAGRNAALQLPPRGCEPRTRRHAEPRSGVTAAARIRTGATGCSRCVPGFNQDNFMGMEASDYGGGTPIVDVWRRDGGVAVGHLELTPELVRCRVQLTRRPAWRSPHQCRRSTRCCSRASNSAPTRPSSPRTPAITSACSMPTGASWPIAASIHRTTAGRLRAHLVRLGLRARLHRAVDRGHAAQGARSGTALGRHR